MSEKGATATAKADTSAPVITVAGLIKRYGALTALDNVSIDFPHGRIGLLGPNGAGKTTLLKVLLGILDFGEGRLSVLGLNVPHQTRRIRTRVGYMPERDVFLPGMTAVEMVAYAGRLSGLPRKEALRRSHEALHFVGLEDKRYLMTDAYSTGQRQRAKLACALVHDPELLFLDEPTNGLDPAGRQSMLDLIASLPQRRNLSFILSTHLLKDVEKVCDHVVLLDKGRIKRSATLETMRRSTVGLWEVRPKNGQQEKLAAVLEKAGCAVQTKDTTLLVTLPEEASTALLLEKSLDAELQIRHLAPHKKSLEDAFLEALADKTDQGAHDEGTHNDDADIENEKTQAGGSAADPDPQTAATGGKT
jgi:ABC-2 type transport system ATP-binding protein